MPADAEDIISLGDELLERHPDTFTETFQENQRLVTEVTNISSRHVQNRLAGYITRQSASSNDPADIDAR